MTTNENELWNNRVVRCWGKTVTGKEMVFHPALYHMIDVGHVAEAFFDTRVSPRWITSIAHVMNLSIDNLKAWLPWMISLHDIGKISVNFQSQNETQKKRLIDEGFDLRYPTQLRHTEIGQTFLIDEFSKDNNITTLSPDFLTLWIDILGGHHGQFIPPGRIRGNQMRLKMDEHPKWRLFRRDASQILADIFLLAKSEIPVKIANPSAAVMALTGFTILCDWIGSNSLWFKASPDIPIEQYIPLSRFRAGIALDAAGFSQQYQSRISYNAKSILSNLNKLRPLQESIDRIPSDLLNQPCLAIIEAPTGEGKTEAALALAHRLGEGSGSDEMYYALPTTATSNQMYQRLSQFLRNQLKIQASVKLIHGQAFLIEDEVLVKPLQNDPKDEDGQTSLEWFSSKKRALLAPFGVGTIDQAELAALNTRHNTLRLLGLAGKVLIIDEVHAYDTYMTTIIENLLRWLASLGTSIILLSATLPQSRRDRLAKAYGVPINPNKLQTQGYPSLWVGNLSGEYSENPPASQVDRKIEINLLPVNHDDCTAKAEWVIAHLGKEGCGCWITNTVDRAQKLFAALLKIVPADVECTLIHSRFPLDERQNLEKQLTDRFGPDGKRPKRSIVIATQVLEQSLDLDFDWMITDLAPIDLILQRAGRMHRHHRIRPSTHADPILWITVPQNSSGDLVLNSDRCVYAEYFLLRTIQILSGRTYFHLPQDFRALVQDVYDYIPTTMPSDLQYAWNQLQSQQSRAEDEACIRLIPSPDEPERITSVITSNIQFEESEDKATWITARTRLGEESITIIPLERNGDNATCPGITHDLPLSKPACKEDQLALLRHSLKCSDRLAIAALKAIRVPPLFSESVLLKNAYPLWLEVGFTTLYTREGSIDISLNSRLGLVIYHKKG